MLRSSFLNTCRRFVSAGTAAGQLMMVGGTAAGRLVLVGGTAAGQLVLFQARGTWRLSSSYLRA